MAFNGCVCTSAAGTAGAGISDLMHAGQFTTVWTHTVHLTVLNTHTLVNSELSISQVSAGWWRYDETAGSVCCVLPHRCIWCRAHWGGSRSVLLNTPDLAENTLWGQRDHTSKPDPIQTQSSQEHKRTSFPEPRCLFIRHAQLISIELEVRYFDTRYTMLLFDCHIYALWYLHSTPERIHDSTMAHIHYNITMPRFFVNVLLLP